MIKPKPERIRALALGTAIAATSPLPASAAEFTAVDLYHICSAGMDLNGDINDTQACFNFLGQVWGRGIGAGEICAASPVNNMQIAMTFTAGLWRLPPEYLSQRADIGAAVVFRAYFPCRQAAASVPKPAPAPSANPGELASDIGAEHGLPPFDFYEYAVDAGVNVNDRAALVRLAQCVKRAGWDMRQCGTAQAKRASAAARRSPAPQFDPDKVCEPAQIEWDTLNKIACSVPRLAQQLHTIYQRLHQADPRGMDEGLRGHTLGDVQTACRMVDWSRPQLPLPAAAENCVAGYLKENIELFPDIHEH
jgi:hypothetical protein